VPQPQPQQQQAPSQPQQPQQQQRQHALQLAPVPAALFGQPGGPFISLALPPGASIAMVAGRPVLAKPPPGATAAAANGFGAQLNPAAAAAAGGGPNAAAAVVAGQPALGLPPTLVPAAALSGPQAAAAMAAARTAGSLLSGGPAAAAAAGVHHRVQQQHKPGSAVAEDGSSNGGSGAWCTPGCRRGLSSRGPCFHCGTTISSQWRSGPPHKPVLCNACGLYFRKVQSLPDHTCQVAGALEVRQCVCVCVLGGAGVSHSQAGRHPHALWAAGHHCSWLQPAQYCLGLLTRDTVLWLCACLHGLTQSACVCLPACLCLPACAYLPAPPPTCQGPCGHCGAETSPQWRAGPPEHPTLCDPCGRHFRKTKTLPKRKRRSLTQHFAGFC
jgi:hypothetical protein